MATQTTVAEVEDKVTVRDSTKGKQFVQMVTANTKTSWRDLKQALHLSQGGVSELATSLGYEQRDGVWSDTEYVDACEPLQTEFEMQ